jgi:hypothetical protein
LVSKFANRVQKLIFNRTGLDILLKVNSHNLKGVNQEPIGLHQERGLGRLQSHISVYFLDGFIDLSNDSGSINVVTEGLMDAISSTLQSLIESLILFAQLLGV